MNETFWLGVNYWPPRKAMYWWKEFDRAEVDDDFARIAAFGMQLVRFFLLWEDFQPAPDRVDTAQLDNLVAVMDIAHQHDLQATPTLLVGNMSGIMWFPPWAFSDRPEQSGALQISAGHYVHKQLRPIFSGPGMLRAEVLLARSVAAAVAGHPALHAWDLANEIDQAQLPADPDAGWLWAWTVSEGLRASDDAMSVTYGAHQLSLTTRGLTLPALAPSLDYLAMHGYPIYSAIARGPLDTELVPFVTLLTAQLGGKPALMQEFGLPTAPPGEPSHYIEDYFLGKRQPQFLAGEHDAADYYRVVLDRLWEIGSLGAVAWDYADYAREIWDRPPLDQARRERTFGLFHADGSPKPVAEVMRDFARELQSGALEQRLGPRGSKAVDLGINPAVYYQNPAQSYREAYQEYLKRIGAPETATSGAPGHKQ